jgi:hypothetical protein
VTRVVHVKDKVPGAVYIGRWLGRRGFQASKWANPYKIGVHGTRADVIKTYRAWLTANPALLAQLPELSGKPLSCWCRHDGEERTADNSCHGDVLIELLEATP